MDDDALASLVAADWRRNLEARAPHVRDVYGVCLWADDVNGYFLGSFATEEEFERQRRLPAYASRPAEELSSPGGVRWSVGDWHKFPDDEFLTNETKAALEPLASRLVDDDLDDEVLEAEWARWRKITFAALELAQPLDVLPCTAYAIAFVAFPDMTVEDQVEAMLRTVPESHLQAAFPGWRPGP